VADLDLEARRSLQVEAEHAVVVVAPEPARNSQLGCPQTVEGGTDVVAIVGLEHHVVQLLRQLERRASQGDGVVAGVAVVEAHFERDALGDLHLEPVRLAEAEAVGQERDGLFVRHRRQYDVAESHAVREETVRHQRRREWGRCVGGGEDDLDVGSPRRLHPGQPSDPTIFSRAAVLDHREARRLEARDRAVEPFGIDRFESDRHGVVRRAALDDESVRPSVDTPSARA
jgi:hypothetical protein